jgi:hypothetical protein
MTGFPLTRPASMPACARTIWPIVGENHRAAGDRAIVLLAAGQQLRAGLAHLPATQLASGAAASLKVDSTEHYVLGSADGRGPVRSLSDTR